MQVPFASKLALVKDPTSTQVLKGLRVLSDAEDDHRRKHWFSIGVRIANDSMGSDSFLVSCWIALGLQSPLNNWNKRKLEELATDPIARNDGISIHILSHAISHSNDNTFIQKFSEIVINTRHTDNMKSIILLNADRQTDLLPANKDIQKKLLRSLYEYVFNSKKNRLPRIMEIKPALILEEIKAQLESEPTGLPEEYRFTDINRTMGSIHSLFCWMNNELENLIPLGSPDCQLLVAMPVWGKTYVDAFTSDRLAYLNSAIAALEQHGPSCQVVFLTCAFGRQAISPLMGMFKAIGRNAKFVLLPEDLIQEYDATLIMSAFHRSAALLAKRHGSDVALLVSDSVMSENALATCWESSRKDRFGVMAMPHLALAPDKRDVIESLRRWSDETNRVSQKRFIACLASRSILELVLVDSTNLNSCNAVLTRLHGGLTFVLEGALVFSTIQHFPGYITGDALAKMPCIPSMTGDNGWLDVIAESDIGKSGIRYLENFDDLSWFSVDDLDKKEHSTNFKHTGMAVKGYFRANGFVSPARLASFRHPLVLEFPEEGTFKGLKQGNIFGESTIPKRAQISEIIDYLHQSISTLEKTTPRPINYHAWYRKGFLDLLKEMKPEIEAIVSEYIARGGRVVEPTIWAGLQTDEPTASEDERPRFSVCG